MGEAGHACSPSQRVETHEDRQNVPRVSTPALCVTDGVHNHQRRPISAKFCTGLPRSIIQKPPGFQSGSSLLKEIVFGPTPL